MKWNELSKEDCSLARAVAVLGDRWTLLILRDCFRGVRRFDAFEAKLRISRTMIADRLKTLVEEGVLRKEAYQSNPQRFDYRLTHKGMALYGVIMGLTHWGDVFYADEDGPAVTYRHKACGSPFTPQTTCAACGEKVGARDVAVYIRGEPAPSN